MLLILKESVRKLGTAGSVVNVAPGYGRYLCSKGFGVYANQRNLDLLETQKSSILKRDNELYNQAVELSADYKDVYIIKVCQASADGKLFGSVSQNDIVLELKGLGLHCERKMVRLPFLIKEIGEYEVAIELHARLEVPVLLYVVRSESEATLLKEKIKLERSVDDSSEVECVSSDDEAVSEEKLVGSDTKE